jgi:hypothetical protein
MMQVVRNEMARAMVRRQKADSSESSSEPLVPRAQWMIDTPPYATKEEANRLGGKALALWLAAYPPSVHLRSLGATRSKSLRTLSTL